MYRAECGYHRLATPDTAMIARTLVAVALVAGFASAAPVPTPPKLTAEQAAEFDRLWDACRTDAGDRAHLYLRLIAEPTAATAYLTAKLPPMAMTEAEAKKLLADLDSEDAKVWKKAYGALTVRDIRLALSPQEAWELAGGERQRERLAGLLCGYDGPDQLPPPGARCELEVKRTDRLEITIDWDRDGRSRSIHVGYAEDMKRTWADVPADRADIAVAALERIGTPAARKHLQALADGHEAGHATKVAKAALERLKADPPNPTAPAELWKRDDGGLGRPKAVNQLLDQPKETVAFLQDKLKPLTLTEKEAKALLAKLFSDDETEWKAALAEMKTFDLRLAMSAADARKLAVTPTAERRLKVALAAGPPWAAEEGSFFSSHWDRADTVDHPWLANRWQREEAAVWVLDAIGTDDALAVVKAMATGHKDAGPTKVAKEVLKRRGVK